MHRITGAVSRIAARAIAVAAVMVLASTYGEDPPKDEGQAARLRPMREVVDGFSVEAISRDGSGRLERLNNPIYLYDDPARAFPYGAVWAWGRPGRPAALLTVAAQNRPGLAPAWICEWTSIAPGALSAELRGGHRWEPVGPGLVLKAFPKADPPAAGDGARLREMKELARRFRAFENFTPRGAKTPDRYELRLLPQPVLRYSDPDGGLVDGALFLLAYGRNPEIVLAVEARRGEKSDPAWSYGFARMGAAELRVSLDGREIWTQPSATELSSSDSYWLFTTPRAAE